MSATYSVARYHEKARRRLPKMVSDYLDGGALDEITMRANEDDLRGLQLRQRILADVSSIDVSTSVLGYALRTPVMVAPMGLLDLFHPSADTALARAAAAVGSIFVHSGWSSSRLVDVTAAAPGRVWTQLAFWKDERLVEEHLQRAHDTRTEVLVVPCDVAASEKRERDLRHGFGMDRLPRLRSMIGAGLKPRWLLGFARNGGISFGDQNQNGRPLSLREMSEFMEREENPSVTWTDIARLRTRWSGKIVLKGVMSAEDARRAVDVGADAIYVSNHGGRQFDRQPSTTAALPTIIDAVGDHTEIIVDGGIRRGSDLVTLTALGATACLVGRPAAYGLVVSGEQGAREVLEILTEEARTACAFTGVTNLAEARGSEREFLRPTTTISALGV